MAVLLDRPGGDSDLGTFECQSLGECCTDTP